MDDQPVEKEKTSNSSRILQDSLRSLVGTNSNFSASWFESVCRIINDSESGNLDDRQVKKLVPEKMDSTAQNDSEKDASVSQIQGELAALNAELQQLTMQKRRALNDYLDLKGNIRVFCRLRPFLPQEDGCSGKSVIHASDSSNLFLKIAENKSKKYIFDKVFYPQSTQEEVFSEIEPMIKSALDGYNVCIFAYGQTGSGKTYSMEGRQDDPGIVLRGIEALFEQASKCSYTIQFTFSILEVYMGNLRDLLVPSSTRQSIPTAPCLSIHMKPDGSIDIENLTAVKVNNFEQVKKLYEFGCHSRSTASTKSNSSSSRSHCLICISLNCNGTSTRQKETNKIWMVDLGGSERILKTQAAGRRLEEGKAINLSLSALGDVIRALQDKRTHVPYRNSKLTQVLRDSLGSDAKTLMLVHISLKEEDLCETVCSLGFATRVRSIHLEKEAPDVRAKKEIKMDEMLEKVKELESEHLKVRKDIERLNERLRCLIRLHPLPHTYPKVSPLPSEALHLNPEADLLDVKGFKGAPPSLPRFLRPTISSGHKTGSVHHSYRSTKKKPPITPKKRRPASVYDEPVIAQAKNTAWQSEYGSECSMSTTSFATRRQSTDYETGFSQGPSEYETKEVIFPEDEKSPRSSITSLSHESIYNQPSILAQKPNLMNSESVEDWLHLQMTRQTKTNSNRGKRVLAFPTGRRSNICNQKNSGEKCNREEIFGVRHLSMVSRKHAEDTNYPNGIIVDAKKSLNIHRKSQIADTQIGIKSSDQIVKEVSAHREELEETTKESLSSNGLSILLTETCKAGETKGVMNSYHEDYSASKTHKETEEPSLCSKRLLVGLSKAEDLPKINQKTNLKGSTTSITSFQDEERGKAGILLERLQIVCASAGLGLGIQSLGFGSDFFHALML